MEQYNIQYINEFNNIFTENMCIEEIINKNFKIVNNFVNNWFIFILELGLPIKKEDIILIENDRIGNEKKIIKMYGLWYGIYLKKKRTIR